MFCFINCVQVLNDRRHILTRNSEGEVELWDILTGGVVQVFGKVRLRSAMGVCGESGEYYVCSLAIGIGSIASGQIERSCSSRSWKCLADREALPGRCQNGNQPFLQQRMAGMAARERALFSSPQLC